MKSGFSLLLVAALPMAALADAADAPEAQPLPPKPPAATVLKGPPPDPTAPKPFAEVIKDAKVLRVPLEQLDLSEPGLVRKP